ncbi:MAG: hypothetical protein JSV96_10220 [Candidatus Aminicenantes bacterium]|nr:MAG: hypothetical protein JSV96_10220 [Candidatus Aminicenantes bacterium]
MKKIRAFILAHFEGAIILLVFLGVFAIAFLVYYKLSFLNFFFLPVILSGYFLGKRKAVLTGIFCALLVILYLIFSKVFTNQSVQFSFDEIITLTTWASFLVLTGGIIGTVSEQREARVAKLRRSYIGVLDIMLKYLEVADDAKPRSLRVSFLAGRIAKELGLNTSDVENIKSAALLFEAGDLRTSLHLFEDVAGFMESDVKLYDTTLGDKEKVLLRTTASLLKEVEPLLAAYFQHYVEKADVLDKNLENIPQGSSIIALADFFDKVSAEVPTSLGGREIKSMMDIEGLAGRAFPVAAVNALQRLISPS